LLRCVSSEWRGLRSPAARGWAVAAGRQSTRCETLSFRPIFSLTLLSPAEH